jgi:SAM-dependent methyltransferase
MRRDLHEQNRLSWNAATRAHNSHKRDQAKFLREGGTTLFAEEVELLGDLRGRRLLHLQCNAGQDTLSLAARGAAVTGVDISDEAIAFATRLSAESGIAAHFERADVYEWLEGASVQGRRFDVVFCSYGFLGWLSDLQAWARGVASVLEPGGRFVAVEFHPFIGLFDDDYALNGSYSTGGQPESDYGIEDYVANTGAALAPSGFLEGERDFVNPHLAHEFGWSLSETLQALLDAGLALETVREWPYANGFKPFDDMRELPGGRMMPPAGFPDLPLQFGVVAMKG